MSDTTTALHSHFDDIEQQRQADAMGMWIFLASEALLFGGLFLGYTAYRFAYAKAFQLAVQETAFWIGTANTAVLLTSSLTMALAVRAVKDDRRKALTRLLLATLFLGLLFLGLKFFEYYIDYTKHEIPRFAFQWDKPYPHQAELFFVFYFFMTGLHAIHLTVGCTIVAITAFLAWRGKFARPNDSPVEVVGLYWHLIDIIWVFLYPLLYLAGRNG